MHSQSPPSKRCLVCNNLFSKKETCSRQRWVLSKYCSKKCAQQLWFKKGYSPWNKNKTIDDPNWGFRKTKLSPEAYLKMVEANKRNAKRKPRQVFIEMQKLAILSGLQKGSYKKPRLCSQKNKHPNWKGDDASYTSKHKWILKHWVKTGKCDRCKHTPIAKGRLKHATQWHNINKEYNREDRTKWMEVCSTCHKFLEIHGRI